MVVLGEARYASSPLQSVGGLKGSRVAPLGWEGGGARRIAEEPQRLQSAADALLASGNVSANVPNAKGHGAGH